MDWINRLKNRRDNVQIPRLQRQLDRIKTNIVSDTAKVDAVRQKKIDDINKKIVGSLFYNSKVNNDIFGFGLTKIEYIKKKTLELFCKDVRLSILN